jgi:hypothetical protein
MIMESLGYGGTSVIISTSLITESARGTSVPAGLRGHPGARGRPGRRPRELSTIMVVLGPRNPHADSRLARDSAAPRRGAARPGNDSEVPALLSQRQLRDYAAVPGGRRSATTGHRAAVRAGAGWLGE